MPLFEYECKQCHHRFEKIQSFSDEDKTCPKCGGEVERLISSAAVQFKGAGWYVTDYARKSGGGSAGKPEGGDGAKDSKPAGEKTETKSETKSETKTETKPSGSSETK